jgi:hypothetical protein
MNKVVRYEVTVPHVADGSAPSPYVHTVLPKKGKPVIK